MSMSNRMKLLIIDDNIEITDMLKQYLELSDFEITVANDGKNGLSLIESGDFDRIILDISMPEFNGLDVLENLKTNNFTDFKKITILTATVIEAQSSNKIKSYGVNMVLSKPVNMAELLKHVQG